MENVESPSHNHRSPLKNIFKSSICFSCCFGKSHNHHHHLHVPLTSDQSPDKPRLIRSSSARTKHRGHDGYDMKEKSRNFITRIGRHTRRHSADFRYDALSYSLNFDDGCDKRQLDEFPLRNFTARLPESQQRSSTASREITTFS